MSFLKLSNIGKIYTSANNVSVGIRKINLNFEKGEFVALTGKSGSGKTTLLNVIGGLDSFEEGELYIEGRSTSHYSKIEWDDYVSEYISFIFQDYNILESFTVLENIEFALTSVKNLKERKMRAIEIAERVGLKDRLKTKGALLSGGEKQRTVIARALAKESPIILADEPTGNLDSKNAKSILALLKEVSVDKLVIVVTHNYEDIEEYATRHISISDGEIEKDECFKSVEIKEYSNNFDNYEKERKYIFKNRTKKAKLSKEDRMAELRDKILLGWKRFVSRPKQSIVISIVLFFAVCSIIICTSLNRDSLDEQRNIINDIEGRVIVANASGIYSEDDAKALAEKYGAENYLLNDTYLDKEVVFIRNGKSEPEDYYFGCNLAKGKKVDKGRLPAAIDEVALKLPYNYANKYSVGDKITIVGMERSEEYNLQGYECVIVGIDLYIDNRQPMELYFSDEGFDTLALFFKSRPELTSAKGEVITLDKDSVLPNINPSRKVHFSIDKNLVGNTIASNTKIDENCAIYVKISEKVILFEDVLYQADLDIELGAGYNDNDIIVNLSPEYFTQLLSNGGSQQISLFFNSYKNADKAVEKMTFDGYTAVTARSVVPMAEPSFVEKLTSFLITALVNILFSVAISFIAVCTLIKLMSISRNDIATFRTMGIRNATIKVSTFIQMFIAVIPAIILMIIFVLILYLAPWGVIISFMGWDTVLMIAISIIIMVLIVAVFYNKLLFRNKIKKELRGANK